VTCVADLEVATVPRRQNLAEALDATLLTGDLRLARATGPRCDIEVLHAPR
jgi:hypothetical protein